MQANEVVRFHCGDCQIIFDLCVRGERETARLPVLRGQRAGTHA